MVMVAVGLANNFSALRAIVSEGIQKGHMALHAKNLAIAAGVPSLLVPEVVNFMKETGKFSETCLTHYSEHQSS